VTEPVRGDVFQQPDEVPRGLLLRIAVGTLAVGLSLCVIAYLLLRLREYTLRPSMQFPEAALPAPRRVGPVRQELFTIAAPRPTLLEEQTRELEGYGWVDRAHGVVRVPIEVGMELLLGETHGGRSHP